MDAIAAPETEPEIERLDSDGYFRYGTHEIPMFEMPGVGLLVATSGITKALGVGCIAAPTLIKNIMIPQDQIFYFSDMVFVAKMKGMRSFTPRISQLLTTGSKLRFVHIRYAIRMVDHIASKTKIAPAKVAASHMLRRLNVHFASEVADVAPPIAPIAPTASPASFPIEIEEVEHVEHVESMGPMEFGFDISGDTFTFCHAPTKAIPFMMVDDVLWFRGNNVAEALGYKNPSKAISDHVSDHHKKARKFVDKGIESPTVGEGPLQNASIVLSCNEHRAMWIKEGGLYSLVMASKLPQVQALRDWVCGEVLPAIRRFRSYSLNTAQTVPTNPSTSTRVPVPSTTQPRSTDIVPLASTAHAPSTTPEGSFVSSRMNGRFVSDFFGKSVFYLIRFQFDGHPYMKFGITKDFENRFKSHYALLRDYSFALYFAIEFEERSSLERAFREHVRSKDQLRTVTIGDNNLTEVVDLENWTEDAIIIVVEKMVEQFKMADDSNSRSTLNRKRLLSERDSDIVDDDSAYGTFVADRHFELERLKIEKEFELEKLHIEKEAEKDLGKFRMEKEKHVELAREVMKNWSSLDGADVNSFLKLLLGSGSSANM
jgi:prophage antirepressor-like protein/predicted GIY-YIG superfamily endonuclease